MPKRNKRLKRKPHPKIDASNNMIIETAPTREGGRFEDHLILLYGAVKIGKSTMASLFPGVYFVATEPGYKALKVRKTTFLSKEPAQNWKKFTDFVKLVENNDPRFKGVTVFCIDTATILSKQCMEYVCKEMGIDHPSDSEWGKGWEAYADEFAEWILRLAGTGRGILFIAHEKEREVISRRVKITKASADLPATTYRIINNMVDVILHMSYVSKSSKSDELGELRCLYTKPTEIRDAGDRTGMLPDIIKFRKESQAVRKILSCFEE